MRWFGKDPWTALSAPPGERERARRMWGVGGAVVAVALTALVVLVIPSSDRTPTNTEQPRPVAEQPRPGNASYLPVSPGIDTPVRDGQFEFQIKSITTGMLILGEDPTERRSAQGQFVIIGVAVTNLSPSPEPFSPVGQRLWSKQNRWFAADVDAESLLEGSLSRLGKDIPAGGTLRAILVYDIPEEDAPALIELHESEASPGVRVSLTIPEMDLLPVPSPAELEDTPSDPGPNTDQENKDGE